MSRPRLSRRALVGGSTLAAIPLIGPSCPASGQGASPAASPVADAQGEYLTVADPEAGLLHVHALPSLALVATMEDVAVTPTWNSSRCPTASCSSWTMPAAG